MSAELRTPAGHTGSAKLHIASALEKAFKRTVDVTEKSDPMLIGGACLAVGDERLDGSIQGALRGLQNHLTI